jgi:hypothetical protein
MTDLRKAAEMALESLEDFGSDSIALKLKARMALRQALAQPVDAVNISQERVDETEKREHETWPSVQCVCGGTIYFKYTPPISDYHEGWEEGFKAATREHEPVAFVTIEAALDGDWRKCPSIKWVDKPIAGSLYTAPPKREWVGLTDEDIIDLWKTEYFNVHYQLPKAVEARLKEKNNG